MLISNRANTILLVFILAVGVGIVAMLATGARGGPLDPPDAPAPTDSVRLPGTPISAIPYTISSPGNYYLTRNLTASDPNAHGLTIASSAVTLDLNGFMLQGTSTAGTGDGVHVSSASVVGDVVIKNGTIRLWSGDGVQGIKLRRSQLKDLDVSANRGDGIHVGPSNVVDHVIASENGDSGIEVAFVSDGGFSQGGVVSDSLVVRNGLYGILTATAGITIRGNTASLNGQEGILASSAGDSFAYIYSNHVIFALPAGGINSIGLATETANVEYSVPP